MAYSFPSPLNGIAALCISPTQISEMKSLLEKSGKKTFPGTFVVLDIETGETCAYTRRLWSEIPKDNVIERANWIVPSETSLEGYAFERHHDFRNTGRFPVQNIFPLCRPDGPLEIPLGGVTSLLGLYGAERALAIMQKLENIDVSLRPVILDKDKKPYVAKDVIAICNRIMTPKPV